MLALLLALLLALIWPPRTIVRRFRSGTRLADSRQRWRNADATVAARELPAGDLPDGLRTLWDAREDSDFDQIALRRLGDARAQITATGLLVRAPLAGAGLACGLALGLIAASSTHQPLAALGAAAGSLLMVAAAGTAAGAAVRDSYRAQRRFHRLSDEHRVILGRRLLTGCRSTVNGAQKPPLVGRLAAALVVVAILALLAGRAAASGPQALAIVSGTLVLAMVVAATAGLYPRVAERVAARRAAPAANRATVVGGRVRFTSLGLTTDPAPLGAVRVGSDWVDVHPPLATPVAVADVVGATRTGRHGLSGMRTVAVFVNDGSTLLLRTTRSRKAVRLLDDAGIRIVDS